jgi:hypothetical protein
MARRRVLSSTAVQKNRAMNPVRAIARIVPAPMRTAVGEAVALWTPNALFGGYPAAG